MLFVLQEIPGLERASSGLTGIIQCLKDGPWGLQISEAVKHDLDPPRTREIRFQQGSRMLSPEQTDVVSNMGIHGHMGQLGGW